MPRLPGLNRFKRFLKRSLSSQAIEASMDHEMRIRALEAALTRRQHQESKADQESKPEDWDELYKHFELRFRGSTTLIAERLGVRYKGLLQQHHASAVTPPASMLDLGCGHGEFLDLAAEVGYKTWGVDQSQAAVERCRQRGHKVVQGDLLDCLQTQTSASLDFISFMHVIEHCPHPFTVAVFREAFRALKTGGCFLVETPALFSLWAGARQFYLDPTHIRPIHPEYMDFIGNYVGFSKTQLTAYDPVTHPEVCNFTTIAAALKDKAAGMELAKLSHWLYGPMDQSCILIK